MLRKCFSVKTLLFLFCIIMLIPACGKQHKRDSKINIAYIDDVPISRQALDIEMARLKQRFYKTPMSDKQHEQMRKEVLDILIGGKILYKASQSRGIKISDHEVATEMIKVKKSYPDTKTFKNDFTEADIRQKLAIERFIQQEFGDKTVITDIESKKYYSDNISDFTHPAQIIASHILIKIAKDASEEVKGKALRKIKDIQKQLQTGGDFTNLAKKYSQDSSNGENGDLSYIIQDGQAPPPFEQVAFTLKKGEISDVVSTESGYYLILLKDKKPSQVIHFDTVRHKIKNYLKQRAIQAKIEKFIKNKQQGADIETYL